jgi:hypothetical protein
MGVRPINFRFHGNRGQREAMIFAAFRGGNTTCISNHVSSN